MKCNFVEPNFVTSLVVVVIKYTLQFLPDLQKKCPHMTLSNTTQFHHNPAIKMAKTSLNQTVLQLNSAGWHQLLVAREQRVPFCAHVKINLKLLSFSKMAPSA